MDIIMDMHGHCMDASTWEHGEFDDGNLPQHSQNHSRASAEQLSGQAPNVYFVRGKTGVQHWTATMATVGLVGMSVIEMMISHSLPLYSFRNFR